MKFFQTVIEEDKFQQSNVFIIKYYDLSKI